MIFDVIDIANYDIVLGIFWLKKYGPRIDWRQEIIRLGYDCVIDPISSYQLNAVEDEGKSRKLLKEGAISNPQNRYSKKQSLGTTATRTKQPEQKISAKQENNIPLGYPQEYRVWAEFFEEKIDESALSKHRPWDHNIPLVSEKQPGFGPIYVLSHTEIEMFREYLAEN